MQILNINYCSYMFTCLCSIVQILLATWSNLATFALIHLTSYLLLPISRLLTTTQLQIFFKVFSSLLWKKQFIEVCSKLENIHDIMDNLEQWQKSLEDEMKSNTSVISSSSKSTSDVKSRMCGWLTAMHLTTG